MTMMGKKKKGEISEDDTIKTMNRYSATTILTLLQEVAQSADVTIDWKTIVKRSSTGISSPREYQLLWRHLAYREPLLDEIDGTEPMDDDSDLEFELETDPTASAEVTSQAQECVKVLMSTRLSSASCPPNNSEVKVHTMLEKSNGRAPNTTPSYKEDAAPASVQNTTPVSLHKLTTPTHVSLHNQTASTGPPAKGFERNEAAGVGPSERIGRAEGFEGNDIPGASSAAKKKRKIWTEEEDAELIAGVQRCGERNWVTVLKEHFMHDRTASQLSQRWSILKKRRLSTSNTSRSCNLISLDKSEVLDAARFALKNALGKPMTRSYSMTNAGPTQSATPPKIIHPFSPTVPGALHRPPPPQKPNLPLETKRTVQEASNILQKTPIQAAPEKGNVTPSGKPQSTPKRPPASVKPETKRTVQEASGVLQETPNQVAPDKGNVTLSSKPQSTLKQPPAFAKPENKRMVQEASDKLQETPNQAAPEKGNVTPSSKPQSTPKRPPAFVKPENKRTVQETLDIPQETPNQASDIPQGNVIPSSKSQSTPKQAPASMKPETKRTVQEASDVPQETPNQVIPEKRNVTPSSKPQNTPKRPPAFVQPETIRTVQDASDILQETPKQAAPEKGNMTPSSKPLSTQKWSPASVRPPISTTSSLIKAAAFAAGGRIVVPAAAASLMQAAQYKNVIRIRAGGSQLTSTVTRGRQQANAHPPLPFRMPSPPGNSLMMSNRSTIPSHKKRDNSNITMKIPAAGAQQSSSSPGNAEKMSGKETSATASNGDRGLATGVAEGADSMKSGVPNHDQNKSLEAGVKDSRTKDDVMLPYR